MELYNFLQGRRKNDPRTLIPAVPPSPPVTMGTLRVGCAGWYYEDWVGHVYPEHAPKERWLELYAQLFPVVEVDSTFYALPRPETVRGWIQRTTHRPEFTFATKLPQQATHESLPQGHIEESMNVAGRFLDTVVRPLEAAGRLEAILVQLPPGFAHRPGSPNLDNLAKLLKTLEPGRRRVAVEFRNRSWFEPNAGTLLPPVLRTLTSMGASVAHVDGLGFRYTPARTAPWSYYRLHGRRIRIPAKERALSWAPYDYLYSSQEMEEVVAPVRESVLRDDRTIVIFNNHYRGKAATNAMDAMQALGLPRPRLPPEAAKRTRLDEFSIP